jgi:hypothetical protein
VRIGEYSSDVRVFRKNAGKFSKLFWEPDVILIAQRDEFAAAQTESLLEILRGSEIVIISNKLDRKWGTRGKGSYDLRSCIGGAIIANDQLVRKKGLSRDALQLTLKVLFSVVSTHGN